MADHPKRLTLAIEGRLPAGIRPTRIKVEPELGTFELRGPGDPGDLLATGQFSIAGDSTHEERHGG